MFIFLLILGASLMVYGFKKRVDETKEQLLFSSNKEWIPESPLVASSEVSLSLEAEEEVKDLRHRMEMLEKTLFEELLKWQMERESQKSDLLPEEEAELPLRDSEVFEEEEVSEKKPMPEHVKKVWDLLKEGRSTAEAARELGISKGEVLLLKNLSKHYKE
ncbi:hypothetical protein [Proteiniclasticum ruminis]|uniref:Uncharacterized protein n=1 Tax=Proteiniclasticum ruminis TaxID=398199 RepID=A0A1I5C7R6_9CLOT|nr:hypothetical protein [Proteiniclasticum ruminis]SFN83029.1 hypothetical protein SAMN04488695_10613 [Proteiniclasticum ruminis]